MFVNLYFGIPQIIVTLWLILCGIAQWQKHFGQSYNTVSSMIIFFIEVAVLYWGGFYTK